MADASQHEGDAFTYTTTEDKGAGHEQVPGRRPSHNMWKRTLPIKEPLSRRPSGTGGR